MVTNAEQRAREWIKETLLVGNRGDPPSSWPCLAPGVVVTLLDEIDRLRQQSGDTGEFDRGWNAAIEAAMDYCGETARRWESLKRQTFNDYANAARILEDEIAKLRKGGEK